MSLLDKGKQALTGALGLSDSNFYTPIADNWYRSLPYAFLATDASGTKKIFNLPINPSNINIITHFATSIIATIGGTVEEHAPQRYFDISIQGTTGIAPRYITEDTSNPEASSGREAYTPEFSLSNATGGFFAKTTGQLDSALNKARDVFLGSKKHEAGFSAEQSGYYAFHQFYLFLLKSKSKLTSESESSAASIVSKGLSGLGSLRALENLSSNQKSISPLKFISYKDNQEYTCAITKFELTRSVENPMMYNYSIQLRAYKLQSISSSQAEPVDRLAALGLDGDQSILSSFKNKVSGAKAGVSALTGAFRTVGR
jgi:hypothetical protein